MHQFVAFHQLHAQRNVFGNRKIGEYGKILIDYLDALLNGNDRGQLRKQRAIEGDAAGIRRINAGNDLDERRFSAAVFPHQAQNLAGIDFQINIVQHAMAGERFIDSL